MSLEQAILEHAAAMREVAAAIVKLAEGGANTGAFVTVKSISPEEAAARGTSKQEAADKQKAIEAEREAELEQAVQKVEADAKKEKDGASGAADAKGTPTGAPQNEAPELDYEKEVKPVLVKLVQKCGKQALADLLIACGLEAGQKGDKLNAAQMAEAKAKAEALIAKAG